MKNTILLLSFILTFSSCSILQKTQTISQDVESSASVKEDSAQKFIGNYEIEVFGLPDGSDGKFSMTISNDKDGLKTIFNTEEANQAFDILGTEIEEDILFIDIYVKEYGLNAAFEIYVDGNTVSGYLADMFELEGIITK
jgi:hypothetical protein